MLQAQDYTQLYYHDPLRDFVYSDEVVTEKFRGTTTYGDGVILFASLEDGSYSRMQITLTDNTGVVVKTDTYELPSNQNMFPIAAAYNDAIKTYIVTGVTRSFVGNTAYSTWYMLLDANLNMITVENFELTGGFTPLTASTFVTDVCPVVHEQGYDFAFTGVVLDNSTDADVSGATPANRTMFIAKLKASTPTIGDWRNFTFNVGPGFATTMTRTYPSRIIELPTTSTCVGGFVVAGTTLRNGAVDPEDAFYFRCDNALTTYGFKIITDQTLPTPNYSYISVGDLFYDATSNEVHIAGTIQGDAATGENHYFVDKIINLNSIFPITTYSDTWLGGFGLGTFRLPFNDLNGFNKIARIGTPVNNNSVITGVLYENNPGMVPWPQTFKMPLLFQLNYSNTALANWATAQNPQIDIYPRALAVGMPQTFYPAHDYNKPWHPSHTGFEFDATNQMYALGGISVDPLAPTSGEDYLVINMTNAINTNTCYHFNQNANLNIISLDASNLTGTDFQGPRFEGSISVSQPQWATMQDYSCPAGGGFKENPDKQNFVEDSFVMSSQYGKIHLQSKYPLYQYSIYDMSGRLLQHNEVINNNAIDISISHLPVSIYLLKVSNNKGESKGFKLVNH